MKKVVFLILTILFTTISIDVQAGTKSSKKTGSNVYSSKKYKGHKCPPKRKIINAKYF